MLTVALWGRRCSTPLTNTRFCLLCVGMNLGEAHLIVTLRVTMVTDHGNTIWVFFMIKLLNGALNATRFLFGLSPDVPAFKVHILTLNQ